MARNKMSKSKPKVNSSSRPSAPRRRRQRRGDNHVPRYMALLNDPCNADTDLQAVYPGEGGFIQRFISDGTLNSVAAGTATSGVILFHPNSGGVYSSFQNDPTNGIPISLGSYILASTGFPQAPGQTFLTGSAAKIRALAACVSVLPSAVSVTNMTGEVACGVTSLDSTFGTNSVNDFFALFAARAALTKKQVDCKWYPGAFDDRYSTWNSNTSIDSSDTNVIGIAWRGYPVNAALSARLTSVVEWTPRLKSGLPPSNQVKPSIDHNNAVATLQQAKPDWWHNLGAAANYTTNFLWKHGGEKLAKFGSELASQKAAQYLIGAMEEAPLLLM